MKSAFPVWGIINFCLLCFLLRRWLSRSARQFFSARHHRIDSNIKSIASELLDLKKILNESEKKIKNINGELQSIIRVSEEAALYERWAAIDKGENEAVKLKREMEYNFAREQKKRVGELKKRIFEGAFESCAMELSEGLGDDQRKKIMDKFLAEIEKYKILFQDVERHLPREGRFRVGYRYAYAFFLMHEEMGNLEEGRNCLNEFTKILDENDVLRQRFLEMDLPKNERIAIAKDLLDAMCDDDKFKNFIFLLIANDRIKNIYEIRDIYDSLYKDLLGICDVEITAATEDDADRALKAIMQKFGDGINYKIEAKSTADPSVIGGMKIRVGDKVVDDTVKCRWNRMYDQMLGGF